jgi:hypothetical protein
MLVNGMSATEIVKLFNVNTNATIERASLAGMSIRIFSKVVSRRQIFLTQAHVLGATTGISPARTASSSTWPSAALPRVRHVP